MGYTVYPKNVASFAKVLAAIASNPMNSSTEKIVKKGENSF